MNAKRFAGLFVVATLLLSTTAEAQVRVRGYTRKDGTYVAPHYRSSPDGNFSNNYSTKGNVNPYTGKPGTLTHPSNSSSYYRGEGGTAATVPVVSQTSQPIKQASNSGAWLILGAVGVGVGGYFYRLGKS